MSLLRQMSGRCFALSSSSKHWEQCETLLFDIDDEHAMREQLDRLAENFLHGGYGPGPGYNPSRRFFYDAATNRCFCPEHGRELLLLRTSLPLAVQELAALSLLSSCVSISQMQEAIRRMERLRHAESMLLPTEGEP
jgi:hypothetical protein